jgi:DNA-binding CsgD family transcriptional regulator
VVVTIHFSDARPPALEVVDSAAGPLQEALRSHAWSDAVPPENGLAWHEPTADFPWHAMTMDLASNHCSQVVISAFYAPAELGERFPKQFVASRFQPVLTGYFKLWLLHRSTSRRLQTIIAALAPVDFGVIVLDRDAKIVFENPAAVAMLDQRSALHRCRGSVCAGDSAASVKLRVAIDEALSALHKGESVGGASPLIFIKPAKEAAPLVAAVSPVEQSSAGENDPAAVIHLFEPSTAVDQLIAPFCEWYDLSAMETRLVMMLVTGKTVPEMALREKIKQDTTRTYLKNVFRKTNTKSQADLVRAMLTNSVRLRRSESPIKRR